MPGFSGCGRAGTRPGPHLPGDPSPTVIVAGSDVEAVAHEVDNGDGQS